MKKAPKETKVSKAIRTIGDELKRDWGYYNAWQANIAMSYVDCARWYKERHGLKRLTNHDKHMAANEAAQHFLKLCFGATEPRRKASK